ncbi:MAG: TonB-dependent receptor, partial [Bacteroidales bacterium]|nr:TonB-dependent receptor [Bacteroidales bacterium]
MQSKEVVITANVKKDESNNKMATVSARSFTVEETEKFAGSRGDVARMAMNYAGVSAANDQRNDIIIRGNSPSGLLWRLEDIDIPNPNHFAEGGTTGGPVGMLNNNLLQNSDFFTGAFPAEYGNAMSGVFDLKLRNGNNSKHEFLFQTGFNGFEVGAEGPISKAKQSSYLVNFRYSTLQLMGNIIDMGTAGIPKYQDVSFKLNFPVK